MARPSIWKNGLLNALRILCSLLFPLITFPYVSNILDISDIGRYDFSYAFVQYFITIATFGSAVYGTREGAVAYSRSKEEYSKFASEVFSLNLLTGAASFVLLMGCLLLIPRLGEYADFLLLFSLMIVFNVVGVEWVYTSRADYAFITIRAIAFQVVSLFLMFLLIHTPDDFLLYGFITVFASAGSSLLGFFHARKYCRFQLPKPRAVFRHFAPMAIIFVSLAANAVYVNSSSVLLGFLSSNQEVGQFGLAMKAYRAISKVAMAFTTVAIPLMAVYFSNRDYEALTSTVSNLFRRMALIAFPCVAILVALSDQVILLLSTPSYLDASPTIKILAMAVPFCLLAYLYGQCVLIPMNKEKTVLAVTVAVALFNVASNLVLIPHFGKNAAAFSLVASEFLTFFIYYLYIRRSVPLKGIFPCLVKSGIGALGVYGVCSAMSVFVADPLACLFSSVALSVLLYSAVELFAKNSAMLEIASAIRKRVVRR